MNTGNTKHEEVDSTPQDLKIYLEMDLTPSGEAALDLFARLDLEKSSDEIHLSDIVGPHPSNVTSKMLGWYLAWIAAKRSLALHAAGQLFKERADPTKEDGFLPESKLAFIDENYLKSKLQLYLKHEQTNAGDARDIKKLTDTLEDDLRTYGTRKSELGREAHILNRPLYLFVLIFVIFGSEALLNYESFAAVPWATPAIAWGGTILVGLGIGFAAHFHGTVFKQYAHYFGPAEDDSRRGPAWRMVIGGSFGLSVALGLVYYARSIYLASYLQSVTGFGQGTPGSSSLWLVGGSLLGNVLVFLTGTLWAYMMHDSDPDYSALKKNIDRNKNKTQAFHRKMDAARHRDLEQIEAKYKRDREEAQRASSRITTEARFRDPALLFRRLQAKDNEVLALLGAYRERLVDAMTERQDSENVRIISQCDDPHSRSKAMTLPAFQQMTIRLKYLEGA